MKSKTPTLDKMLSVKEESQSIGQFLEYLNLQNIELAKYHEHEDCCYDEDGDLDCELSEHTLRPIRKNIEQILADYFEIDLNEADREKLKILKSLQK